MVDHTDVSGGDPPGWKQRTVLSALQSAVLWRGQGARAGREGVPGQEHSRLEQG